MAWLFGDGFDFYANASADWGFGQIGDTNWASFGGGGVISSTTPYGSGLCFNCAAAGQGATSITFANSTTIWINFALYNTAWAYSTGGTTVQHGFYLRDATSLQVGVYIRNGGDIIVTNGQGNGTNLYTSSQIIPNASANGAWHHFQFKIVINNTTGSVECRMDGAASNNFTATGLNTRNGTTNSYCNSVVWGLIPTGTAGQGYWDDLYAFNDQGAVPNNWAGQVRCYSYYPSSDNTITWTPNSGANNFSRVNQAYDADTTYVSTTTVNNVDRYNLAALPTTPNTILNVQTRCVARMDDAGPHTVNSRLWSGSSTADAAQLTCSASYQQLWKNNLNDPATSSPWAASTLSTLNIGIIDIL
jgi:hypothetical protein